MMSEFIANRIMKEARRSETDGQNKYRAYFVNTSIYANYKENVDAILMVEGFGNCIVTEYLANNIIKRA